MIYLLLFFLLLFGVIVYLFNGKSFFSPSLIVVFSFGISCITLIFNHSFFGYEDISSYSFVIIIFSLVALIVGELFGKYMILRKRSNHSLVSIRRNRYLPTDYNYSVNKWFLAIVITLGVFVVVSKAITVYKLSLTLGNVGGFWNSFSVVRKYVNSGETIQVNRFITYTAVFVKASSLYCVFVFLQDFFFKKKIAFKLIVPLILYSIYTLTSTARTGVIEMFAAFLIMFFAFAVAKNVNKKTTNRLIVVSSIIVFAILIVVFIIAGNIRTMDYSENTASDFVNYLGSPLIVFSRWLEGNETSPFAGYATVPQLVNILNRLGIVNVSVSYKEMYTAETVLQSSMSNLKTWLKAPIQDFGIAGMIISRFFIGILYAFVTSFITNQRLSKGHVGCFIFGCLLFYPIISASIADKFGNYIQLETILLALCFGIFGHFGKKYNRPIKI